MKQEVIKRSMREFVMGDYSHTYRGERESEEE